MQTSGTAARLTILVDEDDAWHHRPLYAEIVHRAHAGGLAGATVVRGVEGYAGISGIHTTHLWHYGGHIPVMIIIIDDPARIRAFLHELDVVMHKGVVLLDDVEVIAFHRGKAPRQGRRRMIHKAD